MKKSLLALAVLGAFAGAASAQSSVTIYGKIDLGFAKANEVATGNSTLAGAPATDKLTMQQAAGSRLGFRGVEDLGGGLKAIFNIEHRFNADDGAVTSIATPANFWQQAWVGLSGSFGEVRLGRDYTPQFWVALAADPFGYDTVGQAGPAHNQLGLSPVRFSNMISYKTPNMAGFTALVGYAPKESTAAGAKDTWGVNVVYQAGPLYAGLGYENAGIQVQSILTPTGASVFPTATQTKTYIAAVGYDFGFVRPVLSYASGTAENAAGVDVADRSNWTLAATAPLGVGELKALYAVRDNDINNTKIKKFGLGYHYPLSKRTKLYADVGSAKETNLDRRTAFDLGLQHNF